MKCPLCGAAHFREHESGDLVCRNCGAVKGGPPEPFGDDDRHDLYELEGDLIDEQLIEQYGWR